MEDALRSYNRRQDAVRRKHERMAKGYVTKLDKKTGVYVQEPDRAAKATGSSLRTLVWAALAFFGFKVLVLGFLGQAEYLANVETLAQGTMYERVGAWFMQVDPITAKLAEIVSLVVS
ncbi:hypothetical protein [Sagittula sp. S175]|uniref:hypothetical protein n=1 Tax=Sagittula sp. S175 TaxID=3415129 RepID=UPI003C7D459E